MCFLLITKVEISKIEAPWAKFHLVLLGLICMHSDLKMERKGLLSASQCANLQTMAQQTYLPVFRKGVLNHHHFQPVYSEKECEIHCPFPLLSSMKNNIPKCNIYYLPFELLRIRQLQNSLQIDFTVFLFLVTPCCSQGATLQVTLWCHLSSCLSMAGPPPPIFGWAERVHRGEHFWK